MEVISLYMLLDIHVATVTLTVEKMLTATPMVRRPILKPMKNTMDTLTVIMAMVTHTVKRRLSLTLTDPLSQLLRMRKVRQILVTKFLILNPCSV